MERRKQHLRRSKGDHTKLEGRDFRAVTAPGIGTERSERRDRARCGGQPASTAHRRCVERESPPVRRTRSVANTGCRVGQRSLENTMHDLMDRPARRRACNVASTQHTGGDESMGPLVHSADACGAHTTVRFVRRRAHHRWPDVDPRSAPRSSHGANRRIAEQDGADRRREECIPGWARRQRATVRLHRFQHVRR